MELTIVDEMDLDPNVDDIIIEVPPMSKKDASANSVPTQDRFGRPSRVRTRLCFCLPSRLDSCNITKRDKCPSEVLEKSKRTKGEWLWASNPDFGKDQDDGMAEVVPTTSPTPLIPGSEVVISVARELEAV